MSEDQSWGSDPGLSLSESRHLTSTPEGSPSLSRSTEDSTRDSEVAKAGQNPHHQWESRRIGAPHLSPPLPLMSSRGSLNPENSHGCDGEGAWWSVPTLPKPLLCPERSSYLICYPTHTRTPATHQQHRRPPNSKSLFNIYYAFTVILNTGAGAGGWGRTNVGNTHHDPCFQGACGR